MSKFTCVERTIDITYGHITVRLWVNLIGETAVWDKAADKYTEELQKQLRFYDGEPDKLRDYLSAIPDINAFQIIMEKQSEMRIRYGTMFYTVPF
jgi:hypothetical protein